MTSPFGAFLEGGLAGFQTVEGIKRQRKHDRLADELLALRALTERRQAQEAEAHAGYWASETGLARAREAREAGKYGVEEADRQAKLKLRATVGKGLVESPAGQAASLMPLPGGGFTAGPPPDPETMVNQEIGRGLAAPRGTPPSSAFQTLLGGDEKLQKRYGARGQGPLPRAPSLRPGEDAAGPGFFEFTPGAPARRVEGVRPLPPRPAGGAHQPITLDAALRQVKQDYYVPDPTSEDPVHPRWISLLSPGEMNALAKKMAAGADTPEDHPDPQELLKKRTAGPRNLGELWERMTGRKPPAAPGTPTTPDASDTMPARPTPAGVDPARLDDLQGLLDQHEGKPRSEQEAIARDEGYSDEEIAAYFGGAHGAPAAVVPDSVPKAVGKVLADTTRKLLPVSRDDGRALINDYEMGGKPAGTGAGVLSPRIQTARAQMADPRFSRLGLEDRRQVLQGLGYTPQEIRAILAP